MHTVLKFMRKVKLIDSTDIEYRYKLILNNTYKIISVRMNTEGEIVEVYSF